MRCAAVVRFMKTETPHEAGTASPGCGAGDTGTRGARATGSRGRFFADLIGYTTLGARGNLIATLRARGGRRPDAPQGE